MIAAAVFLAATGNGVVRAVLAAAGTETQRSEARLRGGRVIGVIERWMIFGLMVAGNPTAAAIVVSAKSILRFPQLSKVVQSAGEQSSDPVVEEQGRVDDVTEFFLLGSLVSWAMAMALAGLGRS